MGINHGVSTLASDVADNLLETGQVCRVEGSSNPTRGRSQAFHQESNTESVHAFAHEKLPKPIIVTIDELRMADLRRLRRL